MTRLHAVMMVFVFLFGAGCLSETAGSITLNACAAEGTAKDKQEPLQAPALTERGSQYLDDALQSMAQPGVSGAQAQLQKSSECFNRALRLAPDSYEVQLSMGIAYLALARLASQGSDRASLLQGARHILGRAYMLRHGSYEPLYYLAEVAATDGDLELARKLVEPLRVAHVKEGPVNVLLGYLSERKGKFDDAREFYRKAVAAGWPAESLSFATTRLAQLPARAGV